MLAKLICNIVLADSDHNRKRCKSYLDNCVRCTCDLN